MSVQSDSAISPVIAALSDYIAGAADRPLPPAVAEKTRHHILDTLAAILSGSRLRAGKLAAGYVARLGGVAGGDRHRHAAHGAGRVRGARQRHGRPCRRDRRLRISAAASTPAAASCRPRSRSPSSQTAAARDFVRAVALGYDIGARLVMSLGYAQPNNRTAPQHAQPRHRVRRGGGRGGAAAASTRAQVRHVLSYAAQQASGVPYWHRDSEHVEKAFDFGGMGARNGVAGALMVAAGFSGVDDPFTGRNHFYTAFGEKPQPERAHARARHALRDHGGLDQEMVRRLADPVGARRHHGADRRASHRAPTTCGACASPCRTTACTSSTTARCRTCACSTSSRSRSSTAP